jgi:predicted membrane channel-forming protein YqfA (hemolysin III family)
MSLYRSKEYIPSFNYFPWIIGAVLYIGGACIYMTRIPERWAPFKFDIFVSNDILI